MYYLGISYEYLDWIPWIEHYFYSMDTSSIVEITPFQNEQDWELIRYLNVLILKENQCDLKSRLDALKSINPELKVIVIGNNIYHLQESLLLDFVYFILESKNPTCLKPVLKKCMRDLKKEREKKIYISFEQTIISLDLKEILYFQKDNRKVYVHTTSSTYSIYYPYQEIAQSMVRRGFLACRSNVVVNPDFIINIQDDMVELKEGTCIKIVYTQRSRIRKLIMKYVGLKAK